MSTSKIGDRLALTNLVHLATIDSSDAAMRQMPLPVRAMPSHIAVEVLSPIPRVYTRRGAAARAAETASVTWEMVPSTSYNYMQSQIEGIDVRILMDVHRRP